MNTNQTPRNPGRQPIAKSWDTHYNHSFRTNYEVDAGVHTLLFLAGEHCSALIRLALNNFAALHGIPVQDPDFQQSVFIQASIMHASKRQSPLGAEVMEALGRTDVLRAIALATDKAPGDLQPLSHRCAPSSKIKNSTSIAAAPVQQKAPDHHDSRPPLAAPAVFAVRETVSLVTASSLAVPVSIPAPAAQAEPLPSPSASSKPRKPMASIDMGPEIELNAGAAEASEDRNNTDAVRARWMAAHDY